MMKEFLWSIKILSGNFKCFIPFFFFFFFLFPLAHSSVGQWQVPFKIVFILPTDMYNFGHIIFSDREGTRVREVGKNIFFL